MTRAERVAAREAGRRRCRRASGCHRSRSSASAGRRGSRSTRGPVSFRFFSAASTCARLRKLLRRSRRRSMSPLWPLSAIARSIVADVPVCSTSRITRVDEGPTFGILRSVPSGCTQRFDRRLPARAPRRRRACSPTCSASISGSRRNRGGAPRSSRSCPCLSCATSFSRESAHFNGGSWNRL